MSSWSTCALVLASTLVAAGCVETGTYEKAVSDLGQARHAGARKDEELRAYQWQVSVLEQQLRDAQQRSDALRQDFFTQVQQLTAANASLGERLNKVTSERAALTLALSSESTKPEGRDGKVIPRDGSPDALRRMLAAADARNAQILEVLQRLERLLGARPAGDAPSINHPEAAADVLDPWGGSRK